VHKVANGKVFPPQPAPFGSTAFWQSDYGRVVDAALSEAADKVGRRLACPSAPSASQPSPLASNATTIPLSSSEPVKAN
jgi:hypothetical protein